MEIKRNVIFALESRKKNGAVVCENVPILMRVNFAGTRKDFFTGYRIDTAKWDGGKQRVKSGCTNKLKQSALEINTALSRQDALIQEVFREFEYTNTTPNKELLISAYNAKLKPLDQNEEKAGKKKSGKPQAEPRGPKTNLLEALNEFMREQGGLNSWAKSTYDKFFAMKTHLLNFNEKISFDTFTEDGLRRYVIFLETHEGLRNSTTEKQLKLLKWFLRWASKKGYNKNLAYDGFMPKLKKTKKTVVFLTWEELNRLRNYEIPPQKQYLERVKDVFLFCCFTGLRYSDACHLRRSDIRNNKIEVTIIKTGDSVQIELNNQSRAIIEKYKDYSKAANGKVLPTISNQKMNDYLKELCELAGINESVHETYYKGAEKIETDQPKYALVGSHTARRTFICNALSLGVPVQVVMKWTGHSDYSAMKPYIDIADAVKAAEMEKFNQICKA